MGSGTLRGRAFGLVESYPFQIGVLVLISLNAVVLGLETWDAAVTVTGGLLQAADRIFLAAFSVEILARIYAHRRRFFLDPWSLFDFIVVGMTMGFMDSGVSVLRMLRAFRMLRFISAVPKLRRVVSALFRALPSASMVIVLLALLAYIFAVIATKLFGDAFPELFGTIARSMATFIQLVTLDSWFSGITRPVTEVFPWAAWVVFAPFVIVSGYLVLNLFVAIMIDSMQTRRAEEMQEAAEETKQPLHEEGDRLAVELRRIHDRIDELARRN